MRLLIIKHLRILKFMGAMHAKWFRGSLIMSRSPPSCESVLEPKATEATQSHPKATLKPPKGHILGIASGVQSHPQATPRLPQGYPKATPRLHQGSTKAPPRLHQSQPKAALQSVRQATSKPGGDGNRLFFQSLGPNEKPWQWTKDCQAPSPRRCPAVALGRACSGPKNWLAWQAQCVTRLIER